MKIRSLTPMLRTKDIKSTIEFYTSLLGFHCNDFNEEWGWASLSKDDIDIMVASPNEHMPFDQPAFTGSFYFNIDNADECWQQLKDKTRVCYPLESFEYGMKEFAVFDNNGYLLQFGETITKISES